MSDKQGASALATGGWKLALGAVLFGVLIGALAVSLYFNFRGSQAPNEAMVRNYILEHGEVLPEAMERLQRRQAREAVLQNRQALERPYRSAWAGAMP